MARRFSAQRALHLLLNMTESDSNNEDTESDEENYYERDEAVQIDQEGSGDNAVDSENEDQGDIEIASNNSESSSESEIDEIRHEGLNANGIQYRSEPFDSRRRNRNVVEQEARVLANPRSPIEAFDLFVSPEMIREIQRHTNRKASDLRRASRTVSGYMINFSFYEVRAGIGLFLKAGAVRDNMTEIEDLWNPVEGRPLFRAVMSKNRFKFFLRCLRFDNYRSRRQRLAGDRLAAISSIWQQFIANLRRHYIPGDTLTVDEQLVGYRGQIPGRTYIPSKPAKYGLKIFWLAEAGTGFALNAKIYTGRERDAPVHRQLGKDVVMELAAPYFNTGREIVTDNFFTSHNLATSLLENRLTLLGTIRSHRREIPASLKSKKRPVESSLFVYDHANKIVLVSYIPKKNKNVILLSSSHSGNSISPEDRNKPTMILDYNRGKAGVDQLDQNIDEFTCRRKTVRWPLIVFYNILDVGCYNAYLLLKAENPNLQRKSFIKELAFQLSEKHAKLRHTENNHLPQPVKDAGILLGLRQPKPQQHQVLDNKVGHCNICYKNTRSKCEVCAKVVCPQHRVVTKICKCQFC